MAHVVKENIKIKGYVSDFKWEPNERICVSTEGDVELLRKKPKVDRMLELENKINKLENTIDAISFFCLVNSIILIIYILTKGF